MKKIVVALLVCLPSLSTAQAPSASAKQATKSTAQTPDLTVDQLRVLAQRVHLLRAEPKKLTLHVGQTVNLTAFKIIVVDGAGRQLGATRDFDFAVKPGEPASVFPKRITGDRVGKTVLTLRYPRTAWSGAPASRPSVDVPVTVVK
jgi:hypothetical protein